MRKLIIYLAASVLFFTAIAATKHEGTVKELSETERLFYTCKIWGFLKYYHPKIGTGAYKNWDERLLKVLSNTEHIETSSDFSEYLNRWIYSFGPLKKCTTCNQQDNSESFLQNFDLSWTQAALFSDELKGRFKDIERNRHQGDHFFIEKGKVGQFEPKNEESFMNLLWKEKYQRLIPLFRYWNYIEYFFPYKYQTDQAWDDVLLEMIPKFMAANTKLDFHLAMLELVVKIDDTHALLSTIELDNWPLLNYLPVRLKVIDNQVVVSEIIDKEKAKANNLQIGDIISKVANEPAMNVFKKNLKFIRGSNEAAKKRSISFALFIGMKDQADVTLIRNGETIPRTVSLHKFTELDYQKPNSEKWKIITDSIVVSKSRYNAMDQENIKYDSTIKLSIGYVDMGRLTKSDVDEMMSDLKESNAIVFDVRNYPKGTYRKIAGYLLPNKENFAVFTMPDFSYPGKFNWSKESSCGKQNESYYEGQVILLVDENTQSHAEYTCMALQTAPNVTTIGSQTAGADGNVTKFPLIKSYYTVFSGIGVFYPDKSVTQRVGIKIDILATPTIEGIKSGKDEVLAKAIQVVKERME